MIIGMDEFDLIIIKDEEGNTVSTITDIGDATIPGYSVAYVSAKHKGIEEEE
jgi:hypothetical protein